MTEIRMRWHGDSFEPIAADQAYCNDEFVIGMVYKLEPVHDRDPVSEKHAFAALKEAYKQLPHSYDGIYQNVDHFRKDLLMKEGYATTQDHVFDTEEDALRMLPNFRRMSAIEKDYSIIEIAGRVIRVTTARSMSRKSMKPREFQECKWKLINRACGMIGITTEQLRENAGRSA